MTRPVIRAGFAALLLICAPPIPAASPAQGPEGPGPGGGVSTLILGPDGGVYSWRTGDAVLTPLPSSLTRLAGATVRDLAISVTTGKAVLLVPSRTPSGQHRRKQEGSAVVLSMPTPASAAAVLKEIAFEGEGRRVTVSGDGRRAYVLAVRTIPGTAGETAESWLHALDLDTGHLVSTAQLEKVAPVAIALDPEGERLFLAYAGRIVSYTTQPLARSWHYRSTGENRGLFFRPGSAVLFALRSDALAMFDPRVIAARKPAERQRLVDDATGSIPLPFPADSVLFSEDGLMGVVDGEGMSLAFFDPTAGTVIVPVREKEEMKTGRPFYFGPGPGELVVASFPDLRVWTIEPPPLPKPAAVPAAPVATPTATPAPVVREPAPAATPAPTATPTPVPTPAATLSPKPVPTPVALASPMPVPAASPSPAQAVDAPSPSPAGPPVLAGRLSGRIDVVKEIVVYGPGSIVRELARVKPEADGSWRLPLPPPGAYRILPVAENSRPLRCEPNFHTIQVEGRGKTDLDFRIVGAN